MDCITRINFIVINMLCLQCVFYSLVSLINYRVCVKGHHNDLQTSKIIPRWDPPPVSKLPGSATDPPYITTMINFVSMLLWRHVYVAWHIFHVSNSCENSTRTLITKLKRDNKRTSTGAKIESEQQTSVEAKLI